MATYTNTSLKDFQVICKLGDGSFAEVFKVLRKQDSQHYAMKKVRMTRIKQKDRNNALNEIRILASEKLENVIEFKQAFYDDSSSTLCIVMQYAQKGDLLKLIQSHVKKHNKIPQNQIWKALVHITRGLKSLHDKKVLHRDLKGANVFITEDGVYKLGDLNVSKVVKSDFAKTQTGTPYYASPEVWKDQPYGIKSDMWSLGCVLYEMAAQKPPFTATDIQTLYKKIMSGSYSRIPSVYSNELARIISTLLKLDPKQRPSAYCLLNNPIVQSHYDEQCKQNMNWGNDELLSTIKWQHKNLKTINQILPKANYERRISGQTMKKTIVDSFYMDERDENRKNDNNFFSYKIDRVKSLHQNQTKELQKENKSNIIKRQRIASNYEPFKKVEVSSIDQISLFKEVASSQKNTKKQPNSAINKSSNTTKRTSQQAMPPKSIQGSRKRIESLINKIVNQEQIQSKNLKQIGEQIVGNSRIRSRKEITEYR